jgi:hypothetical protein
MALVIGVIFAGLIGGLVANRFLRQHVVKDDDVGIAVLIPAVLFICALALVSELDRPFSGFVKIAPTAMSITAEDVTADFVEDWGEKRLPCNKRGEPLDGA